MQRRAYRLAVVTSHPVQYQTPLFERLAAHDLVDLTVFYGDDRSIAGELDTDFGLPIRWDRPLLEGYRWIFLQRRAASAGMVSRFVGDARIIGHLWRERFDAVFIHSYATRLSILAYLGALLSRTPVMLRCESERLRPRHGIIAVLKAVVLKPLLAATDAALVIGSANRRFYDYYGLRSGKQFFTPYSVDNDYFLSQRRLLEPSRAERRALYGWTDDVTVVGFSGKLIPRKGIESLIAAVATLQAEGLAVGVMLIGDGPDRPHLEALVRSRALKGVVFTGFKNQSELAACYTCLDVFVLPSRFDPWGLVLNEAMVFGLPVVATDMVGASEDLIIDGQNGYVVRSGDVNGLAQALRRCLISPAKRLELGRRSELIVQRYSYDECVRGILEALRCVARTACERSDSEARVETER